MGQPGDLKNGWIWLKFGPQDICTKSCNFNERNVTEFINIISTLKNCKVHFLMAEAHDHFFTVKDLEMIAERDIKVISRLFVWLMVT